jgi:hypothetical protein
MLATTEPSLQPFIILWLNSTLPYIHTTFSLSIHSLMVLRLILQCSLYWYCCNKSGWAVLASACCIYCSWIDAKNTTAGSSGRSVFRTSRNLHTDFLNSWILSCSHNSVRDPHPLLAPPPFLPHSYVCLVYIYVYMCIHMSASALAHGGHRVIPAVFLSLSPPYLSRQSFSLNPSLLICLV